MRAIISSAAALLIRSIMTRAGLDHDRMFISECRSVDWQSLTFTGERHILCLGLSAPGAVAAAARLRDGIGDAEWHLRGHVVADIMITGERMADDGSILVSLEALTLSNQA